MSEVIKNINMCQTSINIYIKVATGALNRLNDIRGQYRKEYEVFKLEEQLSTIAMYLEFDSRKELISYLEQDK